MANVSPETIVIPARTFYSTPKFTPKSKTAKIGLTTPRSTKPKSKSRSPKTPTSISPKSKPKSPKSNIKKVNGNKPGRRRQSNPFDKPMRPLDIDFILGKIQNKELRNRIVSKREEKQQIEKVHKILRSSENPIALARPLRALNIGNDANMNTITASVDDATLYSHPLQENESADFSDLDSFSDESLTEKDFVINNQINDLSDWNDEDDSRPVSVQQENIETESVLSSRAETPNRKFFKSGRTASIPKEVKITENISAMVCNGKISLMTKKKPRPRKSNTNAAEISDAKAAVDIIIKNLDIVTATNELESQEDSVPKQLGEPSTSKKPITLPLSDIETVQALDSAANTRQCNDSSLSEDIALDGDDYSEFRQRIPYNTQNPTRIEEQHYLLDFLISNNICNEETFKIFIGEPEKHREEAVKIVNEVLPEVSNETEMNTEENDEDHVECTNLNDNKAQQKDVVSELAVIDNNILGNNAAQNCIDADLSTTVSVPTTSTNTNEPKLFSIFCKENYQPLKQSSTRRQRTWNAGFGTNQYQIDAGQKEFGAKQCKKCGLVYTAHEPEEEKLHRDYHTSLYVLRFKGWIDEDLIVNYPEWGRDGRIIRITDTAHIRRRDRLTDILKIVDKELGFSSYIIPNIFVAYLAVRKCQIVGLCLVQPLKKANKYICNNGVDCCTVEEFDAKCGISRIWVSPLHRRMNIGRKLIEAMRRNTIMGEEIPLDMVAFSAPTEDGKQFAKRLMGNENFLVYQ